MRNIKLTIEYDGTSYLGWQVQARGLTIQGVIEERLAVLAGEKIHLVGSGRTDAGVHAVGQVAHFKTMSRMDAQTIRKALNSLLPPDIVVREVEEVRDDFHARRRATGKIYEYRILNQDIRSSFQRLYAWHIPRKLNLPEMRRAARHLIGEQDFSSFRSVGTPTRTAVRRIDRAEWKRRQGGLLCLEIEGSGFLKQMVRAIVGTLVEVGKGKLSADGFRKILESRDRTKAGPTAPAHGLCLMEVKYQEP